MNIIETNLKFNGNKTIRDLSKIKRIIVHHSGTTVLQTIETIHNYHKNTRGYAGIGYHFYVRKDGSIYRGRPLEYVGAHAYGSNADSVGICFEGDFNKETMQEKQLNAGKELISYLKDTYKIAQVQPHRAVCSTSCPGNNFPLEKIKKGVLKPLLQCDAHIEDVGWTGYKDTSKEIIGTEGKQKRLEAIKFKTDNLDIEYRVHIENIGWQEWKKNEEVAGTTGQSLRIEAIEIRSNKVLEVQEHIENVGWMPSSKGNDVRIGTEGKALRLEAFKIGIL